MAKELTHLMAALSKAHIHHPSGVIIPKKSKGNRATYANLPDVVRFIHEMCHPNGLLFTQGSKIIDGKPGVFSRLTHIESGEFIECESFVTAAINAQSPDQAWGGSTTYHRRYDAMMLLGLFCEDDPEDDDGYRNANPVERPQSLDQKQITELIKLIGDDMVLMNKFLATAKVKSLMGIPADRYEGAVIWVKNNK
jgi:hypothetical protein